MKQARSFTDPITALLAQPTSRSLLGLMVLFGVVMLTTAGSCGTSPEDVLGSCRMEGELVESNVTEQRCEELCGANWEEEVCYWTVNPA